MIQNYFLRIKLYNKRFFRYIYQSIYHNKMLTLYKNIYLYDTIIFYHYKYKLYN